MSAAPALAFEEAPRRVFPRHPITVPLDLIVLRSGVPETLPGRCTDISETGAGAVVADQTRPRHARIHCHYSEALDRRVCHYY